MNITSHSITYAPSKKKKRKHHGNIITFNPLFNNSAVTNISKGFFSLFAKHFPPRNLLHKISNKLFSSATAVCVACKESLQITTSVSSTSQHQKKEKCSLATDAIKQTVFSTAIATKNPSFIRHQSIHQMAIQWHIMATVI